MQPPQPGDPLMWDLRRLFQRHAREIDRFLRRRGHSAETAAALTQDTFVRLMTAAPRAAEGNPRAYLHQVARNLSTDLYRRESLAPRADLSEEAFHNLPDAAPSAETKVYDRQRLLIVERALGELPTRTRRAFALHQLGEMTIAEVGEALGLSTSRTWTLIRQAYLHLRARLNE